MLRRIRIILACIFLAGITLLLFGTGADWWGWMAKIQFLPATLRAISSATLLNVGTVLGLILLTLIFGRIYCSVICPLGVFQDIIIWLQRKYGLFVNKMKVRRAMAARSGNKGSAPVFPEQKASVKHYAFSPERKVIRYGLLILTLAALFAGIQVFVALIAPYSSYGRIVRGIAGIGEGAPTTLIVTGTVTLLIIVTCSLLGGRIWCNTICPVGTVLGLFSRKAILKPHIDASKCNGCGRCVRGCKSSCIDGENHVIDYSRCVVCLDCIGRCKQGAISYSRLDKTGGERAKAESGTLKPEDKDSTTAKDNGVSRRDFLATGVLLAGGVAAQAANQGGFAEVVAKTAPERSERIVPPGAQSLKHFYDRCTACQLCVTSCPNGVLRPSTDLSHFLQPEAGYENGFCRPECTVCSDICPTGAILPVTKEEKSMIHIGRARVNFDLCIKETDGVACGNCARHCPTGAIRMVKVEGYRMPMPTVAEEICIGCGACEYLCPARPISAITVDGLSEHIDN